MHKTNSMIRTVLLVAAVAAGGWSGLCFAAQSDAQVLIEAHRQAAAETQKKVAFHEQMGRKYQEGRGGGKIDMVGHCKFWADYYRKLAAQEEQAAKELEGKVVQP